MDKPSKINNREAFILEVVTRCKLNDTSFRDPADAAICKNHLAAGLIQLDTEYGMLAITPAGEAAVSEAKSQAVVNISASTANAIASYLREYR